jgi:hypothetical protein
MDSINPKPIGFMGLAVLNKSQSWFLKPCCSWIIGVEEWGCDQFIYFHYFRMQLTSFFLYWNHSGWRLRYQYMRTMIVTKSQIFGSDIHDPTSVHFGYMTKMPCNNKSMLKSLCYGLHSQTIIHSTCKVQVRKTQTYDEGELVSMPLWKRNAI